MLCICHRLVMYSRCFRELDLDGNLIGELGGFEMMRALTKREQREITYHTLNVLLPSQHVKTRLTYIYMCSFMLAAG